MTEDDANPEGRSGGPPDDAGAHLPHDRDERATSADDGAGHAQNRATSDQARQDVESGKVDTERIGTPNDVPSSRDNAGRR